MKSPYRLAVAAVLPLLLACAAEPPNPFLVQTDGGPVEGFAPEGGADVAAFLGIPFAQAPEGHMRWRPPVAVEPWTDALHANDYRSICPQGRAQLPQGEDCLYLNVWTPIDRTGDEPLPVMVWIHGGGFRAGNGRLGEAPATGRGAGLARRGVMVVSIQYRLAALGFFAHPALAAEAATSGEPEGSHGVLDMIAALEWVQRNAAAFGGDPDRVTIFGVSAGGMAVNTLMSTPASAGLFHRAIAQSGYGTWRLPHLTEARWGAAFGARPWRVADRRRLRSGRRRLGRRPARASGRGTESTSAPASGCRSPAPCSRTSPASSSPAATSTTSRT